MVTIVPAYDRPEIVGELFDEYTQLVLEGEPGFWEYLEIQHYDEEVKHLEKKYGKPGGRLYLAFVEGKPAGCIGLRKMDDVRCEMKRLYVRPEFRGKRLGRILVEQILADAREIGYREMVLDTFAFLDTAIRLYEKYGFYYIDKYSDSPLDNTIYMKLDL